MRNKELFEWEQRQEYNLELWCRHASQQHLVLPCTITNTNGSSLDNTPTILDCGCSGYAFMDNSFARKNNLQTFPLHDPRALRMFNGEVPKDSIVREVAQIRLKIGNHYENTFCFLTQLGLDHPVILRIPWL